MYSKIAINNVKKSFKEYTIYFLTLTFAVCIFYSFNSIESQKAMLEVSKGSEVYIKMLMKLLTGVSIFVSLILGSLIVYANNFLIKKRKKELAIYMTLGMGRNKISRILLFETIIVGIISLIVGLVLGIVVSQGLSLFAAKLFDAQMSQYRFMVSLEAIGKTCMYFSIMFLLVIIFNIRIISKYKLIDMLTAQRKNESIKIKSKLIAILLFIVSVMILLGAYALINEIGFKPDNQMFWVTVVLGSLGTALWFFSLSNFLILILQKSKKVYYKNLNIFIARQISSKINTNFTSITIICLMLFLTIGTLSTGIAYKNSLEAGLRERTPFDATVYTYTYEDSDENLKDVLEKIGFKFDDPQKYVFYNTYKINSNLLSKITGLPDAAYRQEVAAIRVSDYNTIRKIKGEQSIQLGNNEVLITSDTEAVKKQLSNFIEEKKEIELNGINYSVKDQKTGIESLETNTASGRGLTLIVPDDAVVNTEIISQNLNINFDDSDKEELSKKYENMLDEYKNGGYKEYDLFINGQTREMVYSENKGMSSIVLFIGIYLGIIFLVSSAAVLALQQLSEASDSIDRYKSLRKIGASEKMVNKTIFIQIFIYFMAPLSLALIHSVVGISVIKDFIEMFGDANILLSSIVTALTLAIIYGGYFYVTYLGYKNLVKKK